MVMTVLIHPNLSGEWQFILQEQFLKMSVLLQLVRGETPYDWYFIPQIDSVPADHMETSTIPRASTVAQGG